MLKVDLDNILPEEDALGRIREIFDKVENEKETYVITKGGKPVFAIVDIERLEREADVLSAPAAAPVTTEPAPVAPAAQAWTPPLAPEPAPMAYQAPVAPAAPAAIDSPLFESDPLTAAPTPLAPLADVVAPVAPLPEVPSVPVPASPTGAPAAPAAPAISPLPSVLPPLGGADLPDMPGEDLNNDSPLA